jgi:hypothetical protein
MKYLLSITTAAMLIAGSAMAQDATTRGGAESAMPSTKQNSPMTGESTKGGQGVSGSHANGRATINNAPVNSSVQKEDQIKQAPRTGDSSKTIPTYR